MPCQAQLLAGLSLLITLFTKGLFTNATILFVSYWCDIMNNKIPWGNK